MVVDVVDPSGRPIPGVVIVISGPSDETKTDTTNDEGRVTFKELTPGNWNVMADAEDLEPQELLAVVAAGRTTNVKITMSFPEEIEPEPEKKGKGPSPWLRGSSIHIPFTRDPEQAFDALLDVWRTSRIGMRQDQDGPNPYAPNAVAKGSTIDPGVRIPGYALRNEESFRKWAGESGYAGGLSIVIDGMVAAPGRSVISGKSGVWTAGNKGDE